jgi:hypothetical protein
MCVLTRVSWCEPLVAGTAAGIKAALARAKFRGGPASARDSKEGGLAGVSPNIIHLTNEGASSPAACPRELAGGVC